MQTSLSANKPPENPGLIREITASATWPLRHRVLWPDQPFSYVQLPEDTEGFHYGLYWDDNLVSVISLFLNESEAQFRKFATDSAYQRRGFGSQLLAHLLSEAKQKGTQRIWCNARLQTAPFYQKFGLTLAGQPFLKEGIPYSVMEKYL